MVGRRRRRKTLKLVRIVPNNLVTLENIKMNHQIQTGTIKLPGTSEILRSETNTFNIKYNGQRPFQIAMRIETGKPFSTAITAMNIE